MSLALYGGVRHISTMTSGYGQFTSINGKVDSVDTEYSQSHSRLLHLYTSQDRPNRQNHRCSRLTNASFEIKIPTISEAHPRISKNDATKRAQNNIYGLLRPHLSVELSDTIPTIGCTIKPDNGGAIHTKDVWLFSRPNCKRYGVKSTRQ